MLEEHSLIKNMNASIKIEAPLKSIDKTVTVC